MHSGISFYHKAEIGEQRNVVMKKEQGNLSCSTNFSI